VDSLDPVFDQPFEPTTPAARTDLVDVMRGLAAACQERSGALLAHVSTADTVADLERLRVALGDDQLSFVGYSYGTFLGASYAEAHPDKVRAFVLDGPVDPTMDATQVAPVSTRVRTGPRRLPRRCSAHPRRVST
jgi:pimeloyl-ACP methyl ester carboxylesterase